MTLKKLSGVSPSFDVPAMTRPPKNQPQFRTPTGRTISALSLHHRLKAGRIDDTEIIPGEGGGIRKITTPDGAYELVDDE